MNREKSYGRILKSSSIIGGAEALNYIVGLVKIKVVAILLGPAGVGLIGLYQSVLQTVRTVSGMGIQSSGVREVAMAHGSGDAVRVAETVRTLRRACWATGILGWAIAALLSGQLSRWIFDGDGHAWAIAILGATLLLGAISGGQKALLQGVRRIGDLARISVAAMFLNTAVTLGIYAWLGQQGIVPALVAASAVTLLVTWWFSRKVKIAPVDLTMTQFYQALPALLSLGSAFMWGTLLANGVDLFVRSLVTREFGIDAAGFYQAAWALSGIFAGFVLHAMGADYYPRLTAAIEDTQEAIGLVNEQVEIGILLVLPLLLGTIALAPILVRVLYSEAFLPAAVLIPWFLIGVFGRVISWPLGYIQLAKGAVRWFFATQTLFAVLHVLLVYSFVSRFGLDGVAYAFAILYCIHVPVIRWVGGRLLGYRWSSDALRLIATSAVAVILAITVSKVLSGWTAIVVGVGIAAVASLACIKGLASRLGREHRLVRAIARVPGAERLLGAA